GMDLAENISPDQLFRPVSEQFEGGRAGEEVYAFEVVDRDEVGGAVAHRQVALLSLHELVLRGLQLCDVGDGADHGEGPGIAGPSNWAAGTSRMRSTLALTPRMVPAGSCKITPSSTVVTTDWYSISLLRRFSSAALRRETSCTMLTKSLPAANHTSLTDISMGIALPSLWRPITSLWVPRMLLSPSSKRLV